MVDRLGGITPGDSPAEQAAADVHVVNGMAREEDNTAEESSASAVRSLTHQTSVSAKPADDEHITFQNSPNNARNSSHRTTALRRLNGLVSRSSPTGATNGGSSANNSTQPVLVRTYNSKMKFTKSKKAKDTGSSLGDISEDVKYELPPLSAFSFQEILAAIDPEIRGSIDQIAEICGRSRLSLANEYDSHRPPHGGLDIPNAEESVEGIHHVIHHYLEPVEETVSSHGQSSVEAQASAEASTQNTPDLNSAEFRSTSWALLGIPSSSEGNPTAVTSNPVTQSYNVTSHPYSVTRPLEAHQQVSSTTNGTTLLSLRTETATTGSEGMPFQNLLAWLQESPDTELIMPEHTNATHGGRTAVGTLKGILRS